MADSTVIGNNNIDYPHIQIIINCYHTSQTKNNTRKIKDIILKKSKKKIEENMKQYFYDPEFKQVFLKLGYKTLNIQKNLIVNNSKIKNFFDQMIQ